MRIHYLIVCSTLLVFQLVGCSSIHRYDIVHYTFPDAQAELHETLQTIIKDAVAANVSGLRESHLASNKFTKFGGRKFERQDVEECNDSEASLITSLQDIKLEMKDRKIDVFGDVAIMTCFNHFSYTDDGERSRGVARNTLVFLKTDDGWKIIHEHVTPKKCFQR